MTSHNHDSGSTGVPVPGSQPAHLGNPAQRAAAVIRQTQATDQTGRSGSPGQGMDARSADPLQAGPYRSLRADAPARIP